MADLEVKPAPAKPVLGRWRHLPTAIAIAIALLELSSLGGLFLPDTTSYLNHTRAANLHVHFNHRSPAYPLLLDVLCQLFPAGWRMVVLIVLQQGAVAAIPWLVQRSGEKLGAPRAGFVAALLAALYLPLSLTAQTALSDSLFAFLFAATACATCHALAAGTERAATRAWVVAGVLAAAAVAQRSSGVALFAAPLVALLFTRPRVHVKALATFGTAAIAALALVGLKNRIDHGSFNLVQGAGIHLYCRVAALEQMLPDTPEARTVERVAREGGLPSHFFDQAGWHLHALLMEREHLSQEDADALLGTVARQALRADPWRSATLTWESMAHAVARADAVDYVLDGTLRPKDVARLDERVAAIWSLSPKILATARSLLPPYPPRAADDGFRYRLIAAWSKAARAACGAWILYALLALGLFGLLRRDPALVFLAGAAFAQLAASALGDKPYEGHFDPIAPLFFLALAIAPTRAARS